MHIVTTVATSFHIMQDCTTPTTELEDIIQHLNSQKETSANVQERTKQEF